MFLFFFVVLLCADSPQSSVQIHRVRSVLSTATNPGGIYTYQSHNTTCTAKSTGCRRELRKAPDNYKPSPISHEPQLRAKPNAINHTSSRYRKSTSRANPRLPRRLLPRWFAACLWPFGYTRNHEPTSWPLPSRRSSRGIDSGACVRGNSTLSPYA